MIRSLLLFVLALLVVGALALDHYVPGVVTRGTGPDGSVLHPLPPPFPGKQMVRYVLIGADDRPGLPGRSDTLMVLWVNPTIPRAAILSIPRDLYVDIPGHRANKINHAYSYGKATLTRRTVEDLLDEEMDGTITVNLQGFVKAVDVLGGVVIDVEDYEGKGRGMNYDCPQDGLVIHLKPGRQRLNGYKAMGYVRYRLSNIPGCGSTDFQRAERQQKFLRAMVAQKLKPGNLRQLWRAGLEVWKCVQGTLTLREALDLARCLQAMGPEGLKTFTVPALDDHRHGAYYAIVDQDKFPQTLQEIRAHLAGEQRVLVTPRAEVLNASGRPGMAAAAAEKLKAAGFDITGVGNATSYGHTRTVVLYRGDSKNIAERATKILGCGVLEYDDSGPTPADQPHIQVNVGLDFAADS